MRKAGDKGSLFALRVKETTTTPALALLLEKDRSSKLHAFLRFACCVVLVGLSFLSSGGYACCVALASRPLLFPSFRT